MARGGNSKTRVTRGAQCEPEALYELQARNHELSLLYEIGQLVLRAQDLDRAMDAILVKTVAAGSYDLGLIRLLDASGTALESVASYGLRDVAPGPLATEQPSPTVVAEPRIVEDLADDTEFPWLRSDGVVSLAVAPVRSDDEILGVIEVATREQRVFTPADVRLLEAVGSQIGIAVQKARIYERTRRAYAELQETQDQLLRAQRLEMAGRIAGQVAHDFNNLLTPLVGYPELIKMRLPEGHPAVAFCDAMLESAQRMAALNEDLLVLGRRGYFEYRPTDLNQLVCEAVAHLTDVEDSLTLRLHLAAHLLPFHGAGAQVRRVILNLIDNAREAMGDHGWLTIQTENSYVERSGMGSPPRPAGEYVCLEVRDTGGGIAPEIRDRIFDPFFTTRRDKRRGAGLGLSVVQAVVEDHQGYLDLDSEHGQGTAIRVYLPVSRAAPPVQTRDECRGGAESILVVDDDERQREVLGRLLTTLGYRVETVEGGEAALALLAHHAVDLLLLDMVMPGMDGAETYRRVRELRPRQRAIVISGFAEPDRIELVQALGAGGHVRKPVTLDRLAQAVRGELDRRPGALC